MTGVITGWDILSHPAVTVRCFGWRVFLKALFSGNEQTFLSLLSGFSPVEVANARLSKMLNRCIHLELRSRRIYAAFARAFCDLPEPALFFDQLAQQEQEHADLLALCNAASRRNEWMHHCQNVWEEYLPHLEQHMDKVERSLSNIGSLEEALQLVVQVESGEINRVFQSVLACCDSPFVKRLEPFRRAVEKHITYIAGQLPLLEPRLLSASRELRAMFPVRG